MRTEHRNRFWLVVAAILLMAVSAQAAGPKIARVWRGTVATAQADAYTKYLDEAGVQKIRKIAGNLGVEMWRRAEGEKTEFVVVSYWESKEAIKNFTGPEWEKVHALPDDARYILPPGASVTHYEIVSAETR